MEILRNPYGARAASVQRRFVLATFPPEIVSLLYDHFRSMFLIFATPRKILRQLMLLSHLAEYPCEYENLKFATNSTKMIRMAKKKMTPYECLRNSYESLRILTNFLRTLRFLYINLPNFLRIFCECYKYLRMPLQILRMLANDLRMKRLHSACLPILFLCHLFASIHRVKLYYFVFV